MRYQLGPPEWDTSEPDAPHYRAPAGVVAWIDLRSPAQCGVPGSTDGLGLFVTPNAVSLSGYTNLGTDPQAVLSGARRDGWRTAFGLPNALAAQTIEEALYETISVQADPTGLDRCLPLVPTVARRYELWLAGARVRNVAFGSDGAEAVPLRDLLKRQYRAIRQACLDGQCPPTLYRKVCGYWCRKYRLAYRWFQPDDLPDESDLPPETTISDNFNRADNTDISSGGPLTWTEVVGDSQIVSNAVRPVGVSNTNCRARAGSDLSSADHYADVVANGSATSVSRHEGPMARYDSAANTAYATRLLGDGTLRISKIVTGTNTDLGTGTSQTKSAPDTLRIECNGSTIAAHFNGSSVESLTDTAITTGTRAGFTMNGSSTGSVIIDDFSAADLAVAGGAVPFPLRRRRNPQLRM